MTVMGIKQMTLLAAMSLSIGLSACKPAEESVAYTEATNCFVRNGLKEYKPLLIQSEEEFGKVLGITLVMGKDGEANEIDFSRHNAIALISEPTNRYSQIDIVSFKEEEGQLTLRYKILCTGDQMTFYITPLRLLIIDKKLGDRVRFVKEQ